MHPQATMIKNLPYRVDCRVLHPRRLSTTRISMSKRNETAEERAARKELVKQQKAEKKARREGHVDAAYGRKECTLCEEPKDLLIRWSLAPIIHQITHSFNQMTHASWPSCELHSCSKSLFLALLYHLLGAANGPCCAKQMRPSIGQLGKYWSWVNL